MGDKVVQRKVCKIGGKVTFSPEKVTKKSLPKRYKKQACTDILITHPKGFKKYFFVQAVFMGNARVAR